VKCDRPLDLPSPPSSGPPERATQCPPHGTYNSILRPSNGLELLPFSIALVMRPDQTHHLEDKEQQRAQLSRGSCRCEEQQLIGRLMGSEACDAVAEVFESSLLVWRRAGVACASLHERNGFGQRLAERADDLLDGACSFDSFCGGAMIATQICAIGAPHRRQCWDPAGLLARHVGCRQFAKWSCGRNRFNRRRR
jgi:hypothetical protein